MNQKRRHRRRSVDSGPLNPFLARLRCQEIRTPVDRLRLSTPRLGKAAHLFTPVADFTIAKAWHVLDRLRWDLINSNKRFEQLVGKYSEPEKQMIVSIVMRYFLHLRYRLRTVPSAELNYLNIIDKDTYAFDDFAVYGSRFWYALLLSRVFPKYLLETFSLLLQAYLKIIPEELLNFREQCLSLKKRLSNHETRPERIEIPLDSHMMSYVPIDEAELHSELSECSSSSDQLEHLLKCIVPSDTNSDDRNCFQQVIAQALLHDCPEVEALGSLQLVPTGSSTNGLALYDSGSDLMFHLTWGEWNEAYDYTTTRLLLVLLQSLLYSKLGMKNAGFELFYSEPILGEINFEHAFPHLADPSLSYRSVTLTVNAYSEILSSDLLGKVVAYDERFRQVTLVLKYWHSLSGLSRERSIGSYPLALMVVFALQQTVPPVLPPLEDFVKEESPSPPERSLLSSEELLVHFIAYYAEFDYEYDCICPLSAQVVSRAAICADLPCGPFEEAVIALEDPIEPKKNPLVDCSAEALDHFRDLLEALAKKATQENVILELTKPMDPQPF